MVLLLKNKLIAIILCFVLLLGCFSVPAQATGLETAIPVTLGAQLTSYGFTAVQAVNIVKGLATTLVGVGVPHLLIGAAIIWCVAGATRDILELFDTYTTASSVTVTPEMADFINGAVQQWYNPATTEMTIDGLPIANFTEQSVPYLAVEGNFVFEGGVWRYYFTTVNRYTGTVYSSNAVFGLGLYGVTEETIPTMNFTWTSASYNQSTDKLTAVLACQATAAGVNGFVNNLTWTPVLDSEFPVGRIIGVDGSVLYDSMAVPQTGLGDDVISLTDGMVLGANEVIVTSNDLATTFDITTTASAEDIRNPDSSADGDRPLWRRLFAPIIGFITGSILSNLLVHYLPESIAIAFTVAIYAVLAFWVIRIILNR